MYTLGISCYYHDSAAAVLKDGKVVVAVEEERFSRRKFDDGFPTNAINWCLKEIGISTKDIDSVAFYDKPVVKFERLLDNYIGVAPRGLFSFLDVIPKWLHKRLWIKDEINKHLKGFKGEIIFPEHHISHAAKYAVEIARTITTNPTRVVHGHAQRLGVGRQHDALRTADHIEVAH